MGRRSYEYFAALGPPRSGEWADRLNGMPKYVVSSSLQDSNWNNATVLNGDVVDDVSKLKRELDGEIVVYASRQLVSGERLFGETSDKKPMRLLSTQAIGDGIAYLTYQPVQDS